MTLILSNVMHHPFRKKNNHFKEKVIFNTPFAYRYEYHCYSKIKHLRYIPHIFRIGYETFKAPNIFFFNVYSKQLAEKKKKTIREMRIYTLCCVCSGIRLVKHLF